MRANEPVVNALCETRGIANRELARRMKKSPQFILRLRRGERTASLGTIESLAEALDVPLEIVLLPHAKPVVRSQ